MRLTTSTRLRRRHAAGPGRYAGTGTVASAVTVACCACMCCLQLAAAAVLDNTKLPLDQNGHKLAARGAMARQRASSRIPHVVYTNTNNAAVSYILRIFVCL